MKSFFVGFFLVTSLVGTGAEAAGYVAAPRGRGSNHRNPICRQLEGNGPIDLNIRGAFILRHSLLLISKDWLVYDIPNGNFENSLGQMSLLNVSAVPIELKWPVFRESRRFIQIKDQIVNIYSVDQRKPVIYFDVYNEDGLLYDIKEKRLKRGLRYSASEDWARLSLEATITSVDSMFSIKTMNNLLVLSSWELSFLFNGYVRSAFLTETYYLYYTTNLTREDKQLPDRITLTRQKITPANDPYSNASNNNGSELKLKPIIDWDITPGFIHRDYFHIFDKNSVYIFLAKPLFPNESKRLFYLDTELLRFPAKNYFRCEETKRSLGLNQSAYPLPTSPSELDLEYFTINVSVSSGPQIFGRMFLEQNITSDTMHYSSHAILIAVGGLAILSILILLAIACYLWTVPSNASTTKLVPKRSSRSASINPKNQSP